MPDPLTLDPVAAPPAAVATDPAATAPPGDAATTAAAPAAPVIPSKPDAILVPKSWVNGTPHAIGKALVATFRPILATPECWITDHFQMFYLHPNRLDNFNFPSTHSRAGTGRFNWFDRGDGVLYGAFVDDDARKSDGSDVNAPADLIARIMAAGAAK
jgi:hypothetical protein